MLYSGNWRFSIKWTAQCHFQYSLTWHIMWLLYELKVPRNYCKKLLWIWMPIPITNSCPHPLPKGEKAELYGPRYETSNWDAMWILYGCWEMTISPSSFSDRWWFCIIWHYFSQKYSLWNKYRLCIETFSKSVGIFWELMRFHLLLVSL